MNLKGLFVSYKIHEFESKKRIFGGVNPSSFIIIREIEGNSKAFDIYKAMTPLA